MNNREKTQILRGDMYYADLNPVVGSEQGGSRPVLVVQNDVGNLYSPTVIVAAITAKADKAEIPTHITIAGMDNGLKRDSMVLLEQVRTIDRSRLQEYIGHLGNPSMSQINRALGISVGLCFLKRNGVSQMSRGQRGWIYCRTNKEEDHRTHLREQEERLRLFAEKSRITVTGVSADVCSGLIFERAGLNEVLEAAKAGKMDLLLILSISHLGRDVLPTMECMGRLLNHGVSIQSASEGTVDFIPYQEMLAGILEMK